MPVVRSTPTGTSAMIDAWGRVIGDQRLDNGKSGVIDAVLPKPAGLTPYGRYGDTMFWLLIALGLLAGLPVFRRSRNLQS